MFILFSDGYFAEANLVSVVDTAEANFLAENTEQVESKVPKFWTGMFKSVKGIMLMYVCFLKMAVYGNFPVYYLMSDRRI